MGAFICVFAVSFIIATLLTYTSSKRSRVHSFCVSFKQLADRDLDERPWPTFNTEMILALAVDSVFGVNKGIVIAAAPGQVFIIVTLRWWADHYTVCRKLETLLFKHGALGVTYQVRVM